MENTVNDSVTSYYVDWDRTGRGEDLIWVNVEPLCCVTVQVIRPFLNWVIWFSGVRHMSSLHILDSNPLSDESFMNIFSHTVGYLFVLLMVSFAVQELFSLM